MVVLVVRLFLLRAPSLLFRPPISIVLLLSQHLATPKIPVLFLFSLDHVLSKPTTVLLLFSPVAIIF